MRHTHTPIGRIEGMIIQDCDVVHTTVPLLMMARRHPMVVTIKGDFTIEHYILQRFYPRLVSEADVLTTPSEYIKERLGIERMLVIPNALFPEDAKIASHKINGKLHLATVMNFYFKGKALGAVRMLELLVASGFKNLMHIIVGEGTYLHYVQDYAKDCDLDIRFSGYLPNPYMALCNSDLFLYYSYHDNFPNVILEAMASGLPVLTNKVGAVNEIIESGVDGLIAENDEQYTSYLRELLSDEGLRMRLGANARLTVERRFNWHILVDKYIEIYKEVLDARG